uniref:[Phosphatase 2A protein]-leucine-carboxy methyltransferase 1 n=1 Tax=Romanomermis culicivorax TaxID=13658 RepID=A0A915KJG5_ROMCU
MTEIYDKYIDQKDRERIEKLQFFDEKELLTQLLGHYCVVIAVNQDDEICQSEHRNLSGPDYFLLGADVVRDLKELDDDGLKLIPDFRTDLPTLFLSECVLIYMSCKESSDLCSFLSGKFAKSCFVNYEL